MVLIMPILRDCKTMGVLWIYYSPFVILVLSQVITQAESALLPSITFNAWETFIKTSNQVYKMELDLYRADGGIIFSTIEYLQTTDGNSTSTLTTIPGCYLTGFKQHNETHVFIAAYSIHCIQLLNRKDGSRKTLAGICSSSGFTDGKLGVGKFKNPRSIEVDLRKPDRVLITDRYNHALRFVDLITGELGTVISSGFKYPRGLSWIGSELVVANTHYLSLITWHVNGSVSNVLIAGSTVSGFMDSDFNRSRFNYPVDSEKLNSNTSLVADGNNRRLRLLDFNTQVVGSVCFNGENLCTTSSQLPEKVRSVLKVGDDVYVGVYWYIYKLTGLVNDSTSHKAFTSSSNPAPCTSSTQPSIETLVSAGFASGMFIAILLTVIICYFYWKKRIFGAMKPSISNYKTAQPDPVPVSSRQSSCLYDNISVDYMVQNETKPGYVCNVQCEYMGLDDGGYFQPTE